MESRVPLDDVPLVGHDRHVPTVLLNRIWLTDR